ncbi:MAG: hypothetical protein OEV40_17420, partial [Acidimicrobiia bacterium]|nr:hypothetical protein [Acidimicrobiia bacterium]
MTTTGGRGEPGPSATGRGEPAASPVSPWTPSRTEWAALLDGEPRYRVDQVWEGLYERGQAPQENTTLPKTLRAQLDALARPGLALEATQRGADDQTV